MKRFFEQPGTILLFALVFFLSSLASNVLIADPTFSNVAFAQKKKKVKG